MARQQIYYNCNGAGEVECSRCNGTGKVRGRVNRYKFYDCAECGGTGKVQCPIFFGMSWIEVEDDD